MNAEPDVGVRARAEALLGWAPLNWRVVEGGYTAAARYLVSDGRRRAFVKVATTPLTAGMLRREAAAYEHVTGSFVPAFCGWADDDAEPLLIIEDLSAARWPPPWDRGALDAALLAIDTMHRFPTAPWRTATDGLLASGGWATVEAKPEPFLELGMVTREWLDQSLPRLVEAEANCEIEGQALVHFDLRSDNICLVASGAKFIDWAEARLGNPRLDLGFWLPSLCFEGGPQPDAILADAPEVAAWVSGFFAARAGLPGIPDAPFVRRVQREQLSTALPWAQRALRLADL